MHHRETSRVTTPTKEKVLAVLATLPNTNLQVLELDVDTEIALAKCHIYHIHTLAEMISTKKNRDKMRFFLRKYRYSLDNANIILRAARDALLRWHKNNSF